MATPALVLLLLTTVTPQQLQPSPVEQTWVICIQYLNPPKRLKFKGFMSAEFSFYSMLFPSVGGVHIYEQVGGVLREVLGGGCPGSGQDWT